MNRIRAWWDALQPRERALVALAAACVLAFVAWIGAWRPVQAARDSGTARLAQASDALARAQADAFVVARAGRPRLPGDAATALAASARAAGLSVTRQQPGGAPGEMLLSVDAPDTATVLAWLARLRQVHGIAPVDVRLSKVEGRLRADVLVATGP